MADTEILTYCKNALRISDEDFNEEVQVLIDSCKEDLCISGVKPETIIDSSASIRLIISTYCKAHFGLGDKDSEKYEESYLRQKASLIVTTEYGVPYVE